MENFDLPDGGLLDPPWQREMALALLMVFSLKKKNYIKSPWSSNEMHSHDNTQSLMFITFQNTKNQSCVYFVLIKQKKDEGSK